MKRFEMKKKDKKMKESIKMIENSRIRKIKQARK